MSKFSMLSNFHFLKIFETLYLPFFRSGSVKRLRKSCHCLDPWSCLLLEPFYFWFVWDISYGCDEVQVTISRIPHKFVFKSFFLIISAVKHIIPNLFYFVQKFNILIIFSIFWKFHFGSNSRFLTWKLIFFFLILGWNFQFCDKNSTF